MGGSARSVQSQKKTSSRRQLGDEKGYLWRIQLNFIPDCRIRTKPRKELAMIVISSVWTSGSWGRSKYLESKYRSLKFKRD